MGKKHGSLTRAGKVRKQTPKVEKKERPKKLPVGRAKKRERTDNEKNEEIIEKEKNDDNVKLKKRIKLKGIKKRKDLINKFIE